jgi:UDP-N-acetylmuramate--alanine ligase
MAALAVTDYLSVPFRLARNALLEFRGVGRRFEVKGEAGGVTVVDDYAHHPTEIRATLEAARARFPRRSLWAVWQPHTYSRTKALLQDFGRSFDLAHHVVVLPVYAARETDRLGLSNGQVADALQASDVHAASSREDAVAWLRSEVRPGDVVLTLGAGDGDKVGEWLLAALEEANHGDNQE